jgi:C-terminal processing protease CtpA/Prc
MIHPRKNLVLAFALTVAVLNTARASNFIDLAFYPAPKANDRRGWAIQNFGPVGIGIQLEQGFNMKINNVEVGSPAAKTGQLEKGQVIESINGVSLKDRPHDPRKVLAQLITNAEASDGRIDLLIKNKGKT